MSVVVTVEDTQAPIIVPPPALVIEGDSAISIDDLALGRPAVVDLADLHPQVTSSASANLVEPDSRLVVTWAATDSSGNLATADQLVTVKTPGTNNPPTADPASAATLTSQPVEIQLTASDPDVLDERADPLSFAIVDRPPGGEFIAPLLPYFIEDYRTDTTGVLTDDVAFANAANQLVWLDNEYCANDQDIPANFVFEPLYVHVKDNGDHYYLDRYARCGDFGESATSHLRISRWSRERAFLGQFDYDLGGVHNSAFTIDSSGHISYLLRFGVNDLSLQVCDSDFSGSADQAQVCDGFNFGDPLGNFDLQRASYALVDVNVTNAAGDPLIYLTDRNGVNVYFGQSVAGRLVNDEGEHDFLDSSSPCQVIPGGGGRAEFGMTIDATGNFFIADSCAAKVHKFAPTVFDDQDILVPGSYVGWMGRCTGPGAGPDLLACDQDEQRSRGFSCLNSTCSGAGSGADIGQFDGPVYLAMDPNDVLYVADYSNQRIQRFDPDGTFAGQAQSTGNGVNADSDGAFVLGNIGPPRHVSVNSDQFFVVDQAERFVHVFDTSPFKEVTDNSAVVEYVSNFDFHSDTDTFTFSVDDGLAVSAPAQVSVLVNRNHRPPEVENLELAVLEDEQLMFVLEGFDPDGILNRDSYGLDTLTLTAFQPENGSVECETRNEWQTDCIYTPDIDFSGVDSFRYHAEDDDPAGSLTSVTGLVSVAVEPVNDVPEVNLQPPEAVAAGFPVTIEASFEDDASVDYQVYLNWGDGTVESRGEATVDGLNDVAQLDGVVLTDDAIALGGLGTAIASHVYDTPSVRSVTLCVADDERAEGCRQIGLQVEHLVVLSVEIDAPESPIADANEFAFEVRVVNELPQGIAGLAAQNVVLTLPLTEELDILSIIEPPGVTCVATPEVIECVIGDMASGSTVTLSLTAAGNGELVYDQLLAIAAEARTDSPSLGEISADEIVVSVDADESDSDGDGMSDAYEEVYALTDASADEDSDGLNNLEEYEAGTSPVDPDSDGDGISDGGETNTYGTDPLLADSDSDGLSDGEEALNYGSDPLQGDSDEDGIPDGEEINAGLNPLDPDDALLDADADGLSNEQEYALQSDPNDPDTDDDMVSDGDEVNGRGTDPTLADTDGDGLDDALETGTGLFVSTTDTGTDPLRPDTDSDGLVDGAEVLTFYTDPHFADTDLDSLPDGWEISRSRNPLLADYQIAVGGFHGCALTDLGVQCWGLNTDGQAPATLVGVTNPLQISAGYRHNCAIDQLEDASTTVVCWGNDLYDQSSPPDMNDPLMVAAGSWHSCAIDRVAGTNEVVCWGTLDAGGSVSGVPADLENPVRIVANGNNSCVIDATASGDEMICWGEFLTSPVDPLTAAAGIDIGVDHGCVVNVTDSGQSVQCWGNDANQKVSGVPVLARPALLALGNNTSCAVDLRSETDTGVECWGLEEPGRAFDPDSLVKPTRISSSHRNTCVLDQGAGVCWGQTGNNRNNVPLLGIDPDGDGLYSSEEAENGTDPLDPDSDRDGLTDGEEVNFYGTSAIDADHDDDGIEDGDEVDRGLNPHNDDENNNGVVDGDDDDDGDGLVNADEVLAGTLMDVADSDGDFLDDGFEVTNGLDSLLADEDDDGVIDGDDDFDNDQLTNLEEQALGTDLNLFDSDNDGLPDGFEVDQGLDPLDADEDGNSVRDGDQDVDGDGLSNAGEAEAGTDMNNPDSDGDSVPDGDEVSAGYDPLDGDSCPPGLCAPRSSALKLIRILRALE